MELTSTGSTFGASSECFENSLLPGDKSLKITFLRFSLPTGCSFVQLLNCDKFIAREFDVVGCEAVN